MIGALTAVAGLASQYMSSKAQKKANAANLAQFGETKRAQEQMAGENRSSRAMALQAGAKGLKAVSKNYNLAQNALSGQGVRAGRRMADAARSGGSQTRAAAYGRGMLGSSAQAGLQAQTNYNLSRGQSDVAGRLAGLRSTLFQGKGEALAAGQNNMASIMQANAKGNLEDNKLSTQIMDSLQFKAETTDYSAIAGLAQMGFDAYTGGKGPKIPDVINQNGTNLGTPPPEQVQNTSMSYQERVENSPPAPSQPSKQGLADAAKATSSNKAAAADKAAGKLDKAPEGMVWDPKLKKYVGKTQTQVREV